MGRKSYKGDNIRFQKGFLVVLILFVLFSCTSQKYYLSKGEKIPYVRVLLIRNPSHISIASDIGLKIYTGKKSGIFPGLIEIFTDPQLKIKVGYKKIIDRPKYPVKVYPVENGIIYLNGKPYRGYLLIEKRGDIFVINVVDIESYVQGVVPLEIGRLSEKLIEALKSQAIAARTYVVKTLKKRGIYDVVATTYDQVYGGVNAESKTSDKAVKETKGEVAVYRGKPIDAKYFSTSWGRTANSEDVWGRKVPYLRSVYDGRYGKAFSRFSPHYRWVRVYDKKAFFDAVKKNVKRLTGKDIKKVKRITLKGKNRSGMVKTVEIITDRGKIKVRRDKVRMIFADSRGSLESACFDIKIRGNKVLVIGKGYGHGVGMSQYGAIEMAREGYNYKQILKHYYKGIRIKKLW